MSFRTENENDNEVEYAFFSRQILYFVFDLVFVLRVLYPVSGSFSFFFKRFHGKLMLYTYDTHDKDELLIIFDELQEQNSPF